MPQLFYGKSTRQAWRTKTPHGTIAPLATKPGDVVSVDQMESSTPGFLGQNTGRLTQKHYKMATIFVDQASKLGYVYVQQSTDTAATIQVNEHLKLMLEHSVSKSSTTTLTTASSTAKNF